MRTTKTPTSRLRAEAVKLREAICKGFVDQPYASAKEQSDCAYRLLGELERKLAQRRD